MRSARGGCQILRVRETTPCGSVQEGLVKGERDEEEEETYAAFKEPGFETLELFLFAV